MKPLFSLKRLMILTTLLCSVVSACVGCWIHGFKSGVSETEDYFRIQPLEFGKTDNNTSNNISEAKKV